MQAFQLGGHFIHSSAKAPYHDKDRKNGCLEWGNDRYDGTSEYCVSLGTQILVNAFLLTKKVAVQEEKSDGVSLDNIINNIPVL